MCTALSFTNHAHYFGRNLDLEGSFGEGVTIAPRRLNWNFRMEKSLANHQAMIGMAIIKNGMPLFYDAVNENGLCAAGLNFPKNAVYLQQIKGKINLAPFEFIPYLLLACSNLAEARSLLENINLVNLPFGDGLPVTPLHWLIADRSASIVAEPTKDGLKIYENPVGVLTNNPPFPVQLQRLNDFINLSPYEPVNRFAESLSLTSYSRGMGAIGLPGDSSSPSRFVRAAFARANCICPPDEQQNVANFFHILQNVAMIRGCVRLNDSLCEETVYSSCCNTDSGIYYYTSYSNQNLCAVDLHRANLDADSPSFYPLNRNFHAFFDN